MGKDGGKGNEGDPDYKSPEKLPDNVFMLEQPEPKVLHDDRLDEIMSAIREKRFLITHKHDHDKSNINDSPKTVSKDSVEVASNYTNVNEAYALLPQILALYQAGDLEEVRRLTTILFSEHYITPALKLLLKADLSLGEKTFCRALESYLNHLKLSKKKKRNFPIDHNFLISFFEMAIERGLFQPVPPAYIPTNYRDLSVLELMIEMTAVKDKLHLHADLLTALFETLKADISLDGINC